MTGKKERLRPSRCWRLNVVSIEPDDGRLAMEDGMGDDGQQ